jgi:hypothetical protein
MKEAKKMKKMRAISMLSALAMFAAAAGAASTAQAKGRGDGPIIYVTSQGLFYDSIVTAGSLPPVGRFQLLEPPSVMGADLQTEFGPGDPEYVGGRWWVDENGDGVMDGDDSYFSCPLLAPGRDES